jgi:ribosomal protein S18 acetylase RimI-like enzyme
MDFTKIDFTSFIKTLNNLPSCENYHDSLINQSEDYLANYRFYKTATNDLFSISPESNVHLYTNDTVQVALFLGLLDELKVSPKVFFSYFSNDIVLREYLKERSLTSRPFYYLKKHPTNFVTSDSSFTFRLATENDQEAINLWYERFNDEEGATWAVPVLKDNPSLRLYLLYSNSKFVGAAANTLLSESRLWIGRLWVEKEERKKNIATQLMKELETIAFNEGRDSSLLVALHNEKALGLYRKLGYQEVSLNSYWY